MTEKICNLITVICNIDDETDQEIMVDILESYLELTLKTDNTNIHQKFTTIAKHLGDFGSIPGEVAQILITAICALFKEQQHTSEELQRIIRSKEAEINLLKKEVGDLTTQLTFIPD